MDAQGTAVRLRAIIDELSDRFYERDDVVRTLVVTLLAGQHSLVLGPPGTAKSEMARELTGRIEGASYWEILLSKFTAPTRMFGPIDVAALARGEYRQVYEGRATTAHVAFIDEIFKCSTAALNETLGYLNERLAERLRTGRLAQWAELIGRFRQMAGGERACKVENATGELVGVTLGNDLSRVIPSELAGLGLPELRAVSAARYAAGELMLYDSQGEQTTGQGAIIACVDTSHSMYEAGPGGVTREAWAKACALALLDQARHAGRDFVGILFSAADKLQVFRFPAGRPTDMARVLDFAETFLGGGTSYQRPLTAAGELLEEEFNDAARARGDIVMLTNDDCGVTEEWMRGWNDAKHRLGFRVFGVAVGAPRVAEADSVLDALCDNLRSIEDLTDVHAAADLFRVI
ncbi:AAA family ATPase [Streptomyces sp. NPDC127197]|uniref:AAA family ATPase n=1 Tax=Streptomyces sp. NPDC127197 TaxID=3345388 RepID=UPI003643CA91